METRKIKVMIVDDSPTSRELLAFIIESDDRLEVSGYAVDGADALLQLPIQNPDVITMDILMPKMNGYEATERIMETFPVPIVIITSNYRIDEVETSFRAIQAGALAILSKPKGPNDSDFPAASQEIRDTVNVIADLKLIKRRPTINAGHLTGKIRKPLDNADNPNLILAVGIGASLGGPQALAKILSELPDSFPVPVFIVQHISMGFIDGLVRWLRNVTKLHVTVAKDKEIALPGRVYIAPETMDMEILKGNVIHLTISKPNSVHPSLGPLFTSMANTYGPHCIGVILTGMGKDGALEMLRLKNSGAMTIAQDEESCVVFGMPKEAILCGAVKSILPLSEIAATLKNLVK